MCSACGAAPSGSLAVELAPLADAEAMLLVDDGDGEPRELDPRLDQRVGADDQPELAGREHAEASAAGAPRASIR